MNAMSLVTCGRALVGLEDNIWFEEQRTRLASNRNLVDKILIIAEAIGKIYTKRSKEDTLRPCCARNILWAILNILRKTGFSFRN
jgi:uncharacterized protein (DUF849 family)